MRDLGRLCKEGLGCRCVCERADTVGRRCTHQRESLLLSFLASWVMTIVPRRATPCTGTVLPIRAPNRTPSQASLMRIVVPLGCAGRGRTRMAGTSSPSFRVGPGPIITRDSEGEDEGQRIPRIPKVVESGFAITTGTWNHQICRCSQDQGTDI